jgi:hypothetical protein
LRSPFLAEQYPKDEREDAHPTGVGRFSNTLRRRTAMGISGAQDEA